jgi:hypothetical protein
MTHNLFALLGEAPELFLDEIQEWLAVAHCKGNLTNLRRELHLSLAKGNPK